MKSGTRMERFFKALKRHLFNLGPSGRGPKSLTSSHPYPLSSHPCPCILTDLGSGGDNQEPPECFKLNS